MKNDSLKQVWKGTHSAVGANSQGSLDSTCVSSLICGRPISRNSQLGFIFIHKKAWLRKHDSQVDWIRKFELFYCRNLIFFHFREVIYIEWKQSGCFCMPSSLDISVQSYLLHCIQKKKVLIAFICIIALKSSLCGSDCINLCKLRWPVMCFISS
jgi:hypothetical protein